MTEENLYPEPVRKAATSITRRFSNGTRIAGTRGFDWSGDPRPPSSADWTVEVPARLEKLPGSLWESLVQIAYRAWLDQGGHF